MRGAIHGLVIFDVDGTLANTNAVDESCYAQAVTEVLGFTGFSTDWGAYKHSTDNGIVSELIVTHGRRAPTLRDLRHVRARFVELIAAESIEPTRAWSEVGGAGAMLDSLSSMGWHLAIATGGWGASARCKLARVGVSIAQHAFACADDAFARLDIIKRAIHRARGGKYLPEIPVIYVGDGRWDVDAARLGGYGFVGIGQDERASRLTCAGSKAVLRDYRDLPAFERALMDAREEYQRR